MCVGRDVEHCVLDAIHAVVHDSVTRVKNILAADYQVLNAIFVNCDSFEEFESRVIGYQPSDTHVLWAFFKHL